MQPNEFTLYESTSQLRLRRLALAGGTGLAGLLGVALCGLTGGFGAAMTALVMLGFATVLGLFVLSLGIVPFFDAKPVGQVTIERSTVRTAGRTIDFARPHTVTVLCSPRIVRTRVQGRHAEYEQSLAYDWLALVLEQDGTRLTFTQRHVDASYDSGQRGERRVNRGFLGRPPTPQAASPDGWGVDGSRFDDLERALSRAISEGLRAGVGR